MKTLTKWIFSILFLGVVIVSMIWYRSSVRVVLGILIILALIGIIFLAIKLSRESAEDSSDEKGDQNKSTKGRLKRIILPILVTGFIALGVGYCSGEIWARKKIADSQMPVIWYIRVDEHPQDFDGTGRQTHKATCRDLTDNGGFFSMTCRSGRDGRRITNFTWNKAEPFGTWKQVNNPKLTGTFWLRRVNEKWYTGFETDDEGEKATLNIYSN